MKDLKSFLRDLNEAFVRSNSEFILEHVTEEVRWNLIGDQIIEGKEKFREVIEDVDTDEAFELRINNIVTEGSTAVVDGSIKPKSASSQSQVYFFCDIYKLTEDEDPKVSEITSYVLETDNV